jgi:large subunit ribosomal protein L3
MGRDTVTVQNVELVKTLPDRNIMLVKGAVPGPKGGLVRIQYAVKSKDAQK